MLNLVNLVLLYMVDVLRRAPLSHAHVVNQMSDYVSAAACRGVVVESKRRAEPTRQPAAQTLWHRSGATSGLAHNHAAPGDAACLALMESS